MIIDITTSDQLQQLIQQNEKVIIKFSTTTCGPCKSYNPIYEKYASEVEGVVVASSVLDLYPDLLAFVKEELGLTTVPTTIAYQDQQIIKKLNGAQNLATLNSIFQ